MKIRSYVSVVAQEVQTGKITEESEGILVTIRGLVTTPVTLDLPYGYQCYVNDGSGEVQVYISSSCNIDVSLLAKEGKLVSTTGFSGQYGTVYEVQPRIQHDLSKGNVDYILKNMYMTLDLFEQEKVLTYSTFVYVS
jgi:DNA/RNA endonuclease YhcR with UshA esterase domain